MSGSRGRGAPLCRNFRGVLAAALLVLFGIAPAAEAQTTLVSNLNQTDSTSEAYQLATSFTTGTNAAGYTLSAVDIVLGSFPDRGLVVVIREDSSSKPGDRVVRFTSPGSLEDGTNTFTAPANTTLAASTTYWLVVNDGKIFGLTSGVDVTDSDAQTGATGWSIGDTALSGSGFGSSSSEVIKFAIKGSAITAPAAPANLQAVVSSGQVELRWDDPSDNTITKWQYQQRTPPDTGIWGSWTDLTTSTLGNSLRGTVTGLTNGTEYEFGVRAVAGSTNGTAATVSATPVAPPAAPTSLTATGGATQVTLNWADPGNATITKYQVRYGAGLSTDSGFSWGTWADVSSSSATTTSATVTGLTNGTEYTFGVRAVGLSGDGAGATVVATPLATNAPAAPTRFRRQLGEEQITLTWADPSNNAITKWQYRQGTGTPLTWSAWTDIPASNAGTTRYTVMGLTGGTRYSFQVRAVAGTVFGAATAARDGIPQRPPPVAPVLTARAGDARVTLTWPDPGDASIDGGIYQFRTAGTNTWSPNRAIPGVIFTRRSLPVTQLVNGTDYEFRMRFQRGSTARGLWSNTVTATPLAAGAAAAPTGFTATAGSGQVDLAWTAPSGTITKYQVRQGTGDPVVWGAWADITGTTSHTVTGLTGGTAYSFQVRAVTGTSVLGAMSATASATPTAPLPGVPGNVAAAAGDAQVTLSWTAPGGTITGYEYQQRVEGTLWPDDWTSIENSASLTEYAVTGLTNGTTYEFHLAAVNTSGSSAPSAAVSATPLASGAPVAPTGLTATAGGSSVTLNWTAPGGTITGYEIRQGTGDPVDWGAWGAISGSDANTTSTTVSSLTVGTAYSFQIRAVNNAVKGAMSDTVSATPVTATVGFKSAILTRTENTNLTVTLVLSQAVSADVDIYLTSTDFTATKGSDYAAGTVTSPDSTTGTYEVTITAGQTEGSTTIAITDDTIPEVNELFQLAIHEIASTVAIASGTPTTLEVIIRGDTDTAIALPDPATLTVTEASGSTRTGTYNVALQVAPNATETVTVAVASQDASVATVTPASLTFTADDWNTGKTVTVTGVDDEIDQDTDRTVAIRHTATSDGSRSLYTDRDPADLIVTVTDDDVAAPGVTTVQASDKAVDEADQTDTATFTVVLNTEPSAPVRVSLTPATGLALSTNGTNWGTSLQLDFATGAWSTAQTVMVRAATDSVDSPSARELTVTYAATSTDTDYSGLTGDAATVTVADDDATTVTLAGTAGDVVEGGTKTFTVTLGRGLVNGETLPVPLTFGGDATRGTDYTTACPTTLPTGVTCANLDSGTPTVTFTGPSTGATATTVTLTLTAATDSTTESGGESVVIGLGTLNASSGTGLEGGASGTDSLADFNITDPAPGVTFSVTDATVSEADRSDTATFTVVLNTRPSANVEMTINAPAGLEVDGPDLDSNFARSQSAFFSTTNWSTAQTVTVRASSESTDHPSSREEVIGYITISSDTDYIDSRGVGPTVTVVDNDATTVTLAGTAEDVAEGATKTFTVTLGRGLVDGETLGVPLAFTGTATRGTDYMTACPDTLPTGVTCNDLDDTSLTPTVTFTGPTTGATARTVTLTLTAATDSTTEAGGETVIIGFGTLSATGLEGGTSTTDSLADFKITDPDASVPTVAITGIPDKIKTTTALTATFTFSEAVTGFVKNDITVTGGTAGTFGGNGTTYTLGITPTSGSNVVVTVAANSATDGTNTGPASAVSATAVWDETAPTVEITGVPGKISNRDAFTVTFNFSETVTGFATGDVSVTNGDKSAFSGSGSSYTVVVTPNADADVTVTVAADSATDGLNTGPASAVSATATWDETAPTVEITGIPAKINNTNALTATFTFSEDVTGFVKNDITVTGGTAGTFTATSATVYTLAIIPTSGSNVVVTVAANSATDGTNTGPASAESKTATWDASVPTVGITGVPARISGTSDLTATFTFSEDVTGFVKNDITVTGGTAGTFTATSAKVYTLAITPDGDANVVVTVAADSATDGLNTGPASAEAATAVWTALVFNPAAVTVVEEASATYTVELSSQPDGNVTVAISGASGEVTFDTDSTTPGTQTTALTFTTTNWDDAQTVTVLAAADGDTANDTATLTHSASGGGYGSVTGDVEVTVTDNDTPGLVLDPTSLTVAEGGSGTYTVKLATQPTGNVTVTVAGASGEVTFDTDGDTGGNQNTLSFTDSTWSTAQTVTVSADQDNDADDDSATLTHSASGGGYGSVSGDVSVTVTDDDTASVVTTAPDDTATEGSTTDTATFTVNLNTEPSSDVTVTVTAPTGLTLDGPDSATTFTSSEDLTFTTGNWSTAQTVTVRATDDNDDSPIGRELTVTWTSASSDSNYNNGSGDAAEITVVDNDATTVTLAGAAGDVAEGATKTFTVTLNRGLVNGETLGVPLTFGGDATRGTDYMTACPDTLPTGVTCNDLDDTSLTPTVTFTGPSTGATATTVTLTLTAATDSTTESGGESVVIGFGSLTATGLGGGTSTTDSLEDFNITDPDASAPTLEISGVPKRITTRAAFTVTFTFSESVTGFVTGDVTVTNGDTSSFSGSGSSYTVVVTPNADADVTVTVDADSATDGTNTGPPADVVATAVFGAPAAPASLSATAGNAAVTLSWTDPSDDTITGYEYRQGVQSSPVTWGSWTPIPNSDKDTVSHTVTGLTDGTEYYFQVRAVSDAVMGEPSAEENPDTVVTPVAVNAPAAPTGLTAAAGDTEVDLSWTAPGGTFTGYQVQQGTGDPLVWGTWTALSGTGTSHKVTGLTNGTAYSFRVRAVNSAVLGAATDAATATPRGAAGVTTTQPGDRQVTEGDTSDTATFTVVLDTQPSSDVTVTVTAPTGLELDGPDAGSTFGSSEALTFTDSNWGTAQTVTVRATDDSTDSPIGRELTVTYSTSSSDSDYSGLSGNAATVTVVDDDPTTVTLAGAAGNITEGETKTFTVTLGRGLVNGETLGVPLTFGGGATRGTDYTTVCPTTLPTGVTCANLDSGNATVTFTGASGRTTATTVTLTLTAATDSTTETGGETVAIGLGTLNASSGTGLGGGASGTGSLSFRINDPSATDTTVPTLSITGVPATISGTTAFTANFDFSESVTDFDTNDITVTGGSKGAFSGSGRSYTMRITPTGGVNVVVTVRANAATDGTNRGPAAAVSRTATWRAPSPPPQQPPTEDDDDDPPPSGGGGGGGGGGGTPSLPRSAISVSAGQMVTEGGEALFRITANPAPTDEITVRVRVSATGDFVDAVQLGERLVTLSASAPTASLRVATIDDRRNEADGTVTVTVLAGGGYTLSQASASLAVTDDDTPALVLTPETLTVDEGGSASYRVALATEPAGNVTVSIAGTNEVTTARNTLTFTAENWNVAQSVTVSAGQDADAADDRARLTHRASGGGYDSVTGSVAVTVLDDDTPGLILTPAALTLAEGASASYTVALATEPTGNVTVSIAGTGDVTVDRSTLSFTSRNWSAAQTVTLFAARDEDVANDSATLAHRARGGDYSSVTGSVEVTVTDAGAAVVSAHLARFGRTVAEQALDGIAGRLRAPRTAGMQKTLAGPRLNVPREGDTAQGTMHAEARRTGFENEYESQSRDLLHLPNAREMLLGSSFTLTTQEAEGTGGSFAFWGRASGNRFDGATNEIGLDGEVLTGLVGADYARGDWLFGLALTHSLSEGGYTSEGASAGKVDASLTAALPYASIQANPRLKLWGAGGYGIGEVTLKTGAESYRADTDWTMAAAGVRGDLLDPAGGPLAVAVIGDGLWMRSTSEEIAALSTADAFVTRLRLGVEASYDFSFDGMGDLTPRVEAGARHDGGDAETGAGMDLGVGIKWDAPVYGLSLDVAGRMLILHENEDFADRGISAAVVFDPSPESERGPSLSLRQAIGGSAEGGIEALFATTTPLDGGGQIGSGAGMRRTLETAYGFSAFGGRFTASPHAEVDFTERARDYALGWRFVPHKLASDLAFGIKATRREGETLAPVHVFGVEATVRW